MGSNIRGGVIKGGDIDETYGLTIGTVMTPNSNKAVALYSGGLSQLPQLYSGVGEDGYVANNIYVGTDGIAGD